ncbi:MAG TPA: enolase C-terminal domain-like protein [Pirellulales bacterium]|nr:enolase C-terminal domain-like protein [Pirellulales bacterium]
MRITAVDVTVVEIPQTPIVAPYRSHLRSSSTTRSAIVRLETDTPQAGGIWPCVKIGHLCEAAGVPCVMHCGHDLGPNDE